MVSVDQHNPYAAPHSVLTADIDVPKNNIEVMVRWRLLGVFATYAINTASSLALYSAGLLLLVSGGLVQLRPIALLLVASVYALAIWPGSFLLSKVAAYSQCRNPDLRKLDHVWTKSVESLWGKPLVLSVMYGFLALSLNISLVRTLIREPDWSLLLGATLVAFPVTVVLCFPLWRAIVRTCLNSLRKLRSVI